jgi:hypothetical protein
MKIYGVQHLSIKKRSEVKVPWATNIALRNIDMNGSPKFNLRVG